MKKTKILAYIGDGEGKTSAAIGHAIRAAGHGKKVAVIQFLKGRDDTGEYAFCKGKRPFALNDIDIHLCGEPTFVIESKDKSPHIKKAKEGIELVKAKLASGNYFLLVLDEVLDAQAAGLFPMEELTKILANKEKTNIILTGRILPPVISKYVDLVTRMQKIKHYYDQGEKGIEGLDW